MTAPQAGAACCALCARRSLVTSTCLPHARGGGVALVPTPARSWWRHRGGTTSPQARRHRRHDVTAGGATSQGQWATHGGCYRTSQNADCASRRAGRAGTTEAMQRAGQIGPRFPRVVVGVYGAAHTKPENRCNPHRGVGEQHAALLRWRGVCLDRGSRLFGGDKGEFRNPPRRNGANGSALVERGFVSTVWPHSIYHPCCTPRRRAWCVGRPCEACAAKASARAHRGTTGRRHVHPCCLVCTA